jgi:hypothetical protein
VQIHACTQRVRPTAGALRSIFATGIVLFGVLQSVRVTEFNTQNNP